MPFNEANIENDFIKKLQDLKYTYREDINDRLSLEENFRDKFENLNQVELTDSDFKRLLETIIDADVFKSAQALRERNTFIREDGTPLQYTLVNTKHWCKNEFEVINQLRINTDNSHHRYDVILLINGIPVVQIELKTLEISPRRAMEQIVDYKNDPGNGYTNTLLCFMQLFIVSNKNNTYYFANNHKQHFSFNEEERFLPIYQLANEENTKITHLHSFTDKFLSKCTLSELISQYMVLVVSEQKLMIMRPYQIYAVKAIVECITQNRGNGYIWHTTGSGKTLTSFKASTLLKENNDIHKCLFVVDRKDLDRQTREEFNKFQEGCVEQNTNTGALVERLLSNDHSDKVIVTTIQKLGLALSEDKWKSKLKSLSSKRMAIIFDECHRSQFGENHKAIKAFFPKAQLFGFTGTPIFEENSNYRQIDGTEATYKTTNDIFEKELHAYTITHAIDDRNVLKFHIDYYKPEIEESSESIQPSESIAQQAVVKMILDKHDKATNNRRFNAVLATSSINSAIEYYNLFKTAQSELAQEEEHSPLNIACVFSPPAEGNLDVKQLQEDLPQERQDNQEAPDKKKAALKFIIDEYNEKFETNHSINTFDLYYQDVQARIKSQKYSNQDYPRKNKLDIVIVVDMLLTGFDSKYLNTLYVDKSLKYHGLIQAFSRTNRVLNDTKPCGNILDFRNQERAVDDAIKLFSGKKSDQSKEIWLVEPAKQVIEKLDETVKTLSDFMKKHELPCTPDSVHKLKGDEAKAEFLNKFKEVQRLKTQLDQYTGLSTEHKEQIENTITEENLRGFRGAYLEIAKHFKNQQGQVDPDSEIAQFDFDFVLFSSAVIDYDYIMKLIAQYSNQSSKQKMTHGQLIGLLTANSNLMDQKEDVVEYVHTLKPGGGLSEREIRYGFNNFKDQKFKKNIENIANKHDLTSKSLYEFVENTMNRMIFDGDKLSDLMKLFDLNWKDRTEKEEALMRDLIPLFKKHSEGREISGLAAYD